MIAINLTEVTNKEEIAKIIRTKMELNGITKSELITGSRLSKTAVNAVLSLENTNKDYRFGSLLSVLSFLKIQLFIGKNDEYREKPLALF